MSLMAPSLFKLSTFLASIWDFLTFPGIYPLYLNYRIYYINFQNKALLFIKLFSFISFVIFIWIFVFSVLAEVYLCFSTDQLLLLFIFLFIFRGSLFSMVGRVEPRRGQSGLCGLRRWEWVVLVFTVVVGLSLHIEMPWRCQGRCRLFKNQFAHM